MRSRRLELPRVAPQRPQRCASTNSATTARGRSRIAPASGHLANHLGVHKPHLHHQPIFFEKNVKNRIAFTITNAGKPYFAGFFKDFSRMIFFQKNFKEPVFGTPKQLS